MELDPIETEGGDPACWAHVFDPERHDLATRRDVAGLVRALFRAAAMDDLLGPVFAAVDGPQHVETATDFWMDQLFGDPARRRDPLPSCDAVDQRTPLGEEHVERWLALFTETVDEHYEGSVAELAKARAAQHARLGYEQLDERARRRAGNQ